MTRGFLRHLSSPISLSVLVSTLVFSVGTHAAPFVPKITNPESYKDIVYGLSEMRSNVNSVQCGGWRDEGDAKADGTSVIDGDVPIPTISPDVPGRINTDPLGDPTEGIGTRGEFEYPDSAFGYLSACDSRVGQIHDEDLAKLGLSITMDEDGNVAVEAGDGTIETNPNRWCVRFDKATPKYCKKLYEAWRQMAVIAPRPPADLFCTPPGDAIAVPPLPEKHYCFDHSMPGHDYTKECRGQECRTPWNPEHENKLTECRWKDAFDKDGNYIGQEPIVDVAGQDRGRASSFYRHYADDFMVPGVTVTAPSGDNTWQLRVECYEYYKEEDPKFTVTDQDAEQCEFVIATDDEQNPKSPAWKPGDNGERQKESIKNPADANEPPREDRDVPEPWLADDKTNLNIVDVKVLKEKQKNFEDPTDITAILGTLLTTRQTGSKTVPEYARTDIFDDSAERNLGEFWEEQQRILLKMVADPQTRLVMPTRFLVGLAKNDPLFEYAQRIVSRSDGNVEITLRAGLEDLGNVLKSFQRIFVAPIQEVRIPILVPNASMTEIDARIADWKHWKEDESRQASIDGRGSKAGQADPLIAKLEQYRDRLEKVRLLRGGLQTYLVKLYDSQKKIRDYFASWYEDNAQLLLEASQRYEQRRELKRIWRLLQRGMLQTDACQIAWCSNQRYSTAVYSLLDNWWGTNPPNANRDLEYKPRTLKDLNFEQQKDQLFDFSNMKFPREPWLVPTLWVVEARLRLPTPPLVGGTPSPASDFPDLPDLPDADVFADFTVPEVELPGKPQVQLQTGDDLEEAKRILREFRRMVDGTDFAQQEQEEQDLKEGASIDQGDNFPLDRDSMRGSYCRFPPSITIPPDPDQEHGKASKIIHVENDIKERLARMFSRWMPERTEDYAGRVARLNEDFPDDDVKPGCKEDVVCYFLPPEKKTTVIWQWFMPENNGGDFTGLADQIKDQTLPENEQENPYFNASVEILKRNFPKFELPLVIDITP